VTYSPSSPQVIEGSRWVITSLLLKKHLQNLHIVCFVHHKSAFIWTFNLDSIGKFSKYSLTTDFKFTLTLSSNNLTTLFLLQTNNNNVVATTVFFVVLLVLWPWRFQCWGFGSSWCVDGRRPRGGGENRWVSVIMICMLCERCYLSKALNINIQ
jgi:hypothetical protein